MQILSGKELRPKLKAEIEEELLSNKVSFYLYSDKEDYNCQAYLRSIKKMLDSFSVPYEEGYVDKEKNEEENLHIFQKEMEGKSVLLARPLNVSYEEKFIDLIPSRYDPDMLTLTNRGMLFKGNLDYLPATAKSVKEIIERYDIDVKGRKCLVVGRSISVGLPCFELLNIKGGAVSIVHSKVSSETISEYVKDAEIIVLATGVSNIISRDDLDSSKTIIDCGFNPNGGDLGFVPDENELKAYTPVPGGVGSLTSYCLLLNAIALLK